MHRIASLTAVAAALVLTVSTACENDTDPSSPIPTGTGTGDGVDDTGLTGSMPAQMTAAPNPDAGGDGAPSPGTSTPSTP